MIVYKQIIWQYIHKLIKIKRLEEKIKNKEVMRERYARWRKINVNKNNKFCKEFEEVMEIEKEMEKTKNKA